MALATSSALNRGPGIAAARRDRLATGRFQVHARVDFLLFCGLGHVAFLVDEGVIVFSVCSNANE
jgi:hypothetical protein